MFTPLFFCPQWFPKWIPKFCPLYRISIFTLQLCGPCFSCSWYYLSGEPAHLQNHGAGNLLRGSLGICPWLGLHDTQGSAVLICNIICSLLFFMHREHFSLKSPPFTPPFTPPFIVFLFPSAFLHCTGLHTMGHFFPATALPCSFCGCLSYLLHTLSSKLCRGPW